MTVSLFEYFTDPVLRAPVIGCMLMCFASSLMGVIVFLRKQSLLGESLSHAAYPGVILGVIAAGILNLTEGQDLKMAFIIMFGAFFTALLGLWIIQLLQVKLKVRNDSALCFVLSTFFGIGITLSSQVQFIYTSLYRQAQVYLFGQAATMTDIHIFIYGCFTIVIIGTVLFFYKELQLITFDREYAQSIGFRVSFFDAFVFVLIVLSVVIGIRSVGVVLMSSMLVAPAASARQFTHKLYKMFLIASFIGVASGFLGVFFSVELSLYFAKQFAQSRFAIPTGPMIVIVVSLICVVSLLFAPERGLLWRLIRIGKFQYQCLSENFLKSLWFEDPKKEINLKKHQTLLNIPSYYLSFLLWSFLKKGWIIKTASNQCYLSPLGVQRATHIVRLHRLWEVYLADYLGVGAEKVHRSAEEMEHIITPELEEELTILLNDPKRDPHFQPIPPKT